jgi:hypothetical protein
MAIFIAEQVPAIVAAAVEAAAKVDQPNLADASELLFLAWRQAFLDEWAGYEKRLDQKAVKLARKLAAADPDRIVFRQPLAYQKDVTGKEWLVRDMVYMAAPFWYAAYYELAFAVLYVEPGNE